MAGQGPVLKARDMDASGAGASASDRGVAAVDIGIVAPARAGATAQRRPAKIPDDRKITESPLCRNGRGAGTADVVRGADTRVA